MAAMPFEIRKQANETNQSLLRRFTKRIRESGIIHTAKKVHFHSRPKGETVLRKTALRRLEKKQEYERLAKLGKV